MHPMAILIFLPIIPISMQRLVIVPAVPDHTLTQMPFPDNPGTQFQIINQTMNQFVNNNIWEARIQSMNGLRNKHNNLVVLMMISLNNF